MQSAAAPAPPHAGPCDGSTACWGVPHPDALPASPSLEALHARLLPPRAAHHLNDAFFRLLGEEESPQRTLHVYTPRHDALVLVSDVDGTVIAAVQVLPSATARGGGGGAGAGAGAGAAAVDAGAGAGAAAGGGSGDPSSGGSGPFSALWSIQAPKSSAGSPAPTASRVQALFSAPDVHFAVVLTNLSSDRLGLVLRPCDSTGALTGKKQPTNSVNVIPPGSSYVCDANASGLALILKEAEEEVRDAETGRVEKRPVAFRDERTRAVSAQAGSYYRLDAYTVGRSRSSNAPHARLVRTHWETRDVFVRALPKFGQLPALADHATTASPPTKKAARRAALSAPTLTPTFTAHKLKPMPKSKAMKTAPKAMSLAVPKRSRSGAAAPVLSAAGGAGAPPAPLRAPSSALLDSSHVGIVHVGHAVASFREGVATDESFGFIMTPAVIGLSVQRMLQRAQPACYEQLYEQAAEALILARARAPPKQLKLPKGVRIFTEERCAICLEDLGVEAVPDCISLPCGHRAVHWDEAATLRACVLCRQVVTARLCVRGSSIVAHVSELPPPRPSALQHFHGWAARAPAVHRRCAKKPVIYLYPTAPTHARVEVRLTRGAAFSCLLPAPRDYGGEAPRQTVAAWSVRALPCGTLEHAKGAAPAVASLFWEAHDFDVGECAARAPPAACVRGADAGDWLLRALARASGLTPREYTEMASFWAPLMAAHPWVLLTFARPEDVDALAPLTITPRPDAVLRVYLLFQGLREQRDNASDALPPARAAPLVRSGFAVVEWGGSEVEGVL